MRKRTSAGRIASIGALGLGFLLSGFTAARAQDIPCSTNTYVNSAGKPGNFTTIGAALAALPTTLTGYACVEIQNTATYNEQVTVAGFTMNGSSITIMALSTATVTIDPPAASTAAFVITGSSVNVFNVNIAPTNSIPYGVLVLAPYIQLSSVNVTDGGEISIAAIAASSWTAISNSNVTLAGTSDSGYWLTGTRSNLSYNTATLTSGFNNSNAGLWINGGSSNTITHCIFSNTGTDGGYGAHLDAGASFNTIDHSTMTSSNPNDPALYALGATSNTITQSYANGTNGGFAAELYLGANSNTISFSTIAGSGSSAVGLYLSGSASNTITNDFLTSAGSDAADLYEATDNAIVASTMTNYGNAGTHALSLTTSFGNAVTNSYMNSTQSMGAYLQYSNGNTISLSTMDSEGDASNLVGLTFNGASSNTVTYSVILNEAYLYNGSDGNTISQTAISNEFSGEAALTLNGVSTNTFTQDVISDPNADGADVTNSSYTTINTSTITAADPSGYAVNLAASFNSGFAQDVLGNTAGTAVVLNNSGFNTFGYSAITGSGLSSTGLVMNASSNNSLQSDVINCSNCTGVNLNATSDGNTINQSTMTSAAAGGTALAIGGSFNNTITYGSISNTVGVGATFFSNSGGNSISNSPITGGTWGVEFGGSSPAASNTLSGDAVTGSTAVYVSQYATGTIITNSMLTATSAGAPALLAGGFDGLTLTYDTLSSPAGTVVFLESLDGTLTITSDTFTGGHYGLQVPPEAGGAFAISGLNFSSLAAGATAMTFTTAGTVVSTFNAVSFDASVGTNINAALLSGGSAITMASPTGPRQGAAFSIDPSHYVQWPSPDPTSGVTFPAGPSSFVNTLTTINGTATAYFGNSVSSVGVSIQDLANGMYWNGASSFSSSSQLFNNATGAAAWTYSNGNLNFALTNGTSYQIESEATDNHSLDQVVPAPLIVTYVTTLPMVAISTPVNGSSTTFFPNVAGTAADALDGISSVDVSISSGPAYSTCWNGSTWGACPSYQLATGSAAWVLDGSLINSTVQTGTTYQIQAQATDLAGNVSAVALSSFVYNGGDRNCATSILVVAGVTTIQNAVNSMGSGLTGNYCIALGSGTFNEQVVVQGIATNGYTITFATTGAGAPFVNPPPGSNAAFVIENSSVSLIGINIAPTSAIAYGIDISSPYASVLGAKIIDPSGEIETAGIAGSSWTTIANSTVAEGGNAAGITLFGAANSTVLGDYLQGTPAVYLSSSNAASVGSSMLVSLGGGIGLVVLGSGSVTVGSSTISGGPSGGGIGLALSPSSGTVTLISDTVLGSPTGMDIGPLANGAVSINGLTFSGLQPGATAINFLSGQFVSTFTGVAFNGANIGANVNASALASGSSLTMATPSGLRGGPAYADDPNGYVHWPAPTIPVSAVTAPSTPFINGLPALSGTAQAFAGASISSVAVSVFDYGNGEYWNGTAFASTPLFLSTVATVGTSSVTWSYATASLWSALTSGTSYQIQSLATDTNAQTQTVAFSLNVTFDTAPIALSISTPVSGSYGPAFPIVSGAVADPISPITFLGVQVSSGPSYGTCWNGFGWIACPNVIPSTGTAGSWTDTAVPNNSYLITGTTYQIEAEATDAASNSRTVISSFNYISAGGCSVSTTVVAGVNTIQGAINSAGSSLSGNFCVVIDSGSYFESVAIRNIATNGFRIQIANSGLGGAPVISPAGGTAAFVIANASVSLSGVTISPSNVLQYGILVSSAYVQLNGIGVNDPTGAITVAGISLSSWTTVSNTNVLINNALGFYLPGSTMATVSNSSATVGNAGDYALFLNGASHNSFTLFFASAPSGVGANLTGANFNTFNQSTLNSTVGTALQMSGASFNTITLSTLVSPMAGATLSNNSNSNTIGQSLLTSSASSGVALYLTASSSNTITQSFITNNAGFGAKFDTNANGNTISQSTITTGGIGIYSVDFNAGQFNTVTTSYVQGPAPVFVNASTGTSVTASAIVTIVSTGNGVTMQGGSVGLILSSDTIVGFPAGASVALSAGNGGSIVLAGDSLSGGTFGLQAAAPAPGATLAVNGLTLASMAPGSTGIDFTGGQYVSTFNAVAFNDANMSVNVNAAALAGGSSISMLAPTGVKSGPLYDQDPNHYVHWPSSNPPTSAITAPVAGYLNSLPGISGTARALAGATVSAVSIAVQNLTNGYYWNGSAFAPAIASNGAAVIGASTATWSYVSGALSAALTSGTSYQIQSQATDSYGQTQAAPAAVSFFYTTAAPGVFIAAPIQGAVYSALATISGTSSDPVGVSTVSLNILQTGAGGGCFSPVLDNFAGVCPSTFSASGTPSAWSYSGVSGIPWISGHQYVVTAIAADAAGNVFSSSNSFTFSVSTGLGSGTPGDGQGTAALLPATVAGCQLITTTATFTTGPLGIAVGGAIAFHVPYGWTPPQGSSAAAPGYVSIFSPGSGFNVQFNPAQVGGANLGQGWTVYFATTALTSGQEVQFNYQGYPGPGASGPQIFSFGSMGGGGGNMIGISSSPALSVTPGTPALLSFTPSTPLLLGSDQNSPAMQIQLLDACGVPTVEPAAPLAVALAANVAGVTDAGAVFYSTPAATIIGSITVGIGAGLSPGFYFNTSTTGVSLENLQASATLAGGPAVVTRTVNLLSAPATISSASVDTGTLGTAQTATISASGGAQSAFINFSLSNPTLPWEVIISSVSGAFAPKVADFTGIGNPGRTLIWNGTNLTTSPSPFLPPGTYYVEILAGGGSAVNTSLSITIAPSASIYGVLAGGPGVPVTASGPGSGPGNSAVAGSTGYFLIEGLQSGSTYLIQATEGVVVSSTVVTVVSTASAVATTGGTNVGTLTFSLPSLLNVAATLPFAAPTDLYAAVSVHNSSFTQTGTGTLHFAAGNTASDNGAQAFGLAASTWTAIPMPPGTYEVDVALPALGITAVVPGVVVNGGQQTYLPIALQALANVYGYAILPSTVSVNTWVSVQAQSLTISSTSVLGGVTVPVSASSAVYALFGLAPGTWTVTAVSQGTLPAVSTVVITGTANVGSPNGVGGLNLTLRPAGTLTGVLTVNGNTSAANISNCPNGAALCVPVTVYSPTSFYTGSVTVVLATSTTVSSNSFTLAGLPDGLYFLSAQLNGFVGGGQNVNVSGGVGAASLSLVPAGSLLSVTANLPGGPHLPSDFKAVSLGFAGTHGNVQYYADMTAGTTVQYFPSSATVQFSSLSPDAYQFQAFYSGTGLYRTASASLAANATAAVLLDLSGATYGVGGTFSLASNITLPNSAGASVVVSSVAGLLANTGSLNFCLLGSSGPDPLPAAALELLPATAAGVYVSGPLQTSGCPAGTNLISPLNAAGTAVQSPNPYLAYAATISANGSFLFPNVPPGVYELRNNTVLDASGDQIPQFAQTLVVTGTVSGLAFQIGSGISISGSVLAPTGLSLTRPMTVNLANGQGQIAASAQVIFNNSASATFSFTQVVNGNYTLLLQDSAYPRAYAAAPLPVTVAGTSLTGENLQAVQSGTIEGHLAIQENLNGSQQFMLISAVNLGLLPASLQIQALSAQGAQGYASGPNGGSSPVLNSNGEFIVDGLLPGTYTLTLTAPGAAGGVALVNTSVPGVVVQGGSVSDIGTADLIVGAQLSGRITSASTGQALANIPVQALPSQRGSGVASTSVQALTDGNGRFVLNGLDPTVRYYDVYAVARGNEIQGETLPPYQQTISPDVDIATVSSLSFAVAPAAASVSGQIVAPAGGAALGVPLLANGLSLPGALVYLQQSGVIPLRNPIADIQFQTDINGNFTIPSLTTGTYVLTATSLGYSALTQLVSVVSSSTYVGVLTMTQAGTLSGTLTNADGSLPSVNSVSQILAATADQSSILPGALTINPNTLTVSGYSISGFKPNLAYHVIIIDSQNNIVTPPEASNVVMSSTAGATINITYRPTAPLVAASAARQGTGFLLSFVFGQPLRNQTAGDNNYAAILTTVSAQGTLSQYALSQDRTILTALYAPGVTESSFTLNCSAFSAIVNPNSTSQSNNQFLIVSTVTFYIGIDGLGQTNVANLNGGDVFVTGDNGRVTLRPGSFNVGVSSQVLITLQVAEESLSAPTGTSAAAAPAQRLASLRYGEQAYPSEILAAVAATPPTVNPLSPFYNIFLPFGISTALSKPAQLTLSYSTAAGTNPSTLNLYWYNPASNSYILTQDVTGASPVINTSNHTITLNVGHFSTYVLFNSAQAVITGSGGAGSLSADNFPNPFDLGPKTVNPLHAASCGSSCNINGTMIGISVPPNASGDATIHIFNLAGTRVRSFDLGALTGGTFYYQNWDGTNDSGRPVASGAYIGELKIGSQTTFFRMAVIKGSGL